MQIAFWGSNYHQIGVTYNLVAVSTMLALEYRMKVLMTHNHFDRSALELSFLSRDYVRNEINQLSDIGIDGLSKFVKYNKIDHDSMSNYTTTLIRNKLELLIGTTITNKEVYYNGFKEVIDLILTSAKSLYDMVFVDIGFGINELSKKILDMSDLIVVNINQNPNVLDDFFYEFNHFEQNFKDKCMFIVGKYDKDSRFNMKGIQRKYGLKNKICVVPYNIEFADACGEGKVIDFLLRNLNADKDDYNYYFMSESRKAVELILKKLKVDISLKKMGE